MVKIKSAIYNEDDGILQLVFENGAVKSINPTEEEEKFNFGLYTSSQLQKLLDENPVEYVELVLNGELGRYIQLCNAEGADLRSNLNSYFEKHRPNATRAEIDGMTREFMMYDS